MSVSQGCPTMQRLAALNGAIALVGSETAFLQVGLFNPIQLKASVMCCTGNQLKSIRVALCVALKLSAVL